MTGTPYHQAALDADAWVDILQAYFASISYAGALFGRMMAALDASDYADNTHVVLWSDHGYHLGEGGRWHKFTLWEESARAPLMLRTAGQTEGRVITTPVSRSDIFPTVLDLVGADIPAGTNGQSLMPLVAGVLPADGPRVAVTWMYGGMSLRTHDHRYILNEDLTEELYDITNDPHRTNYLADDSGQSALLANMRAALETKIDFNLIKGTPGADNLTGTAGNDLVLLSDGNDIAAGGAGDDVYSITSGSFTVIEGADDGFDIIITNTAMTLPDNVESGDVLGSVDFL